MNTIVSFEIAKMLKEKSFEGTKSPIWYYKDGTLHNTPTRGYKGLKCWNTWDSTQGIRWDAPTIAEVVMWLYEKHGIWISVHKEIDGFDYLIDNRYGLGKYAKRIKYPTEAYEVAIEYVLTNLI